MKKLILLTVVTLAAASQAGCSTCRGNRDGGWFSGWFNRGDRCDEMEVGCPPGMPRATMMVPTSPQMLPGPIEIAPAN